MANVLAPFGYNWLAKLDGSPPNSGTAKLRIAYNNTVKIFRGDWVIQLSSGYIGVGAAGGGGIGAGVFWGCKYYSVAGKIPKWSPYWPGADAPSGQDVEAYVIIDPQAKFMVQCGGLSGAALPLTAIGQNADLDATTAGNTSTGLSGMALDDNIVGTTSTLPFHIVERGSSILTPGVNGADDTTSYNYALVTINAAILQAGRTGV